MRFKRTMVSTAMLALLAPTLLSPAVTVKASEMDKENLTSVSQTSSYFSNDVSLFLIKFLSLFISFS